MTEKINIAKEEFEDILRRDNSPSFENLDFEFNVSIPGVEDRIG
ncbi:MAG: hypothetical protein WBB45_17050 [Cyclobacteriaceae bacterium]